jgi:hypothetical protein
MKRCLVGTEKRLNVEHRTPNLPEADCKHRTSNIDDAALYRFYSKRSAACKAPFGHERMVEQLPSASSGLEPVESRQIEFRRKDSLLAFVANLAK